MSEITVHKQPAEMSQLNVAETVQAIIKAGITSDAALAIKELVHLQNQQTDRWAKEQFVRAFARARAKMKTVQAEKAVPGKDKITGKEYVRWFYTPLEDLQDAVEPICDAEGLTISFDSRREGNIVVGVCIVYHESGHEERRECSINVANAEGGDLGAMKKAKRGALTAMFGIKTRHMDENDPRMLGDYITPEEAEELERRFSALKGAEKYRAPLMKYLHAETFNDLYSSYLPKAKVWLAQAEAKMKHVSPPPDGAAPPKPTNAAPSPSSRSTHSARQIPDKADAPKAMMAPPSASQNDDPRTPEEQAEEFAQTMPIVELKNYLMNLKPADRNEALRAAGLKTLVDAPDPDVQAAAYNARLAQLKK